MAIQRACPKCGKPTDTRYCPEHTTKPWAASRRKEKVRSGWAQQRRARFVMSRDDGVCHVCGKAGADEVDHVIPLSQGGTDTPDNLRPIHRDPCHRRKTAAEAQRGRNR